MVLQIKEGLFGTDGVRGKANLYPMTADVALKLGQAAAKVFKKEKSKIKIIIGKDTRVSGYIFENALTAGLCSMGVDVYLVGPMPTPAIAHLVRSFGGDAGIVISASHNPAEDNGIKFFDNNGYKLSDEVESEIEKLALSDNLDTKAYTGKNVGKAYRIDDASGRYIEFAKNSVKNIKLDGIKVVLDCANGAAYRVAPLIFRELGADVFVYGNNPDGLNINKGCGALHPEVIRDAVLGQGADVAISLDGDADRVIMVDENGEDVDGDEIIALCAFYLNGKSKLKEDAVVVTIMSNLGFEKSLKDQNIAVHRTDVGDRYVIEKMRESGIMLGGEQSGHIIFAHHNTTGDGTIAALQVLSIMKKTGKKLSELKKCITKYPQVLESFYVKEKKPIESMPNVKKLIESIEKEMGSEGRVLVRYSGTEKKCRVMVEGKDEEKIKEAAQKISDIIKKEVEN
ncbi:MAG: phosphoglucosamine mutase [Nanobdellota archaeon]